MCMCVCVYMSICTHTHGAAWGLARLRVGGGGLCSDSASLSLAGRRQERSQSFSGKNSPNRVGGILS